MRDFQPEFRLLLREDAVFHTYRWIAWIVAAIIIGITGAVVNLPLFYVWLLIFTGLLNMLATALAQPYVRVAQRRPWLLGLDMLAGVSLVWMSGGTMLPFLPYALGALVLPALILDWQGIIIAALTFVLIDQGALWLSGGSTDLSALRIILPFLFVLTAKLGERLIYHVQVGTFASLPDRSRGALFPMWGRTQQVAHALVERTLPIREREQHDREVLAAEPSLATLKTPDPNVAVSEHEPAQQRITDDRPHSAHSTCTSSTAPPDPDLETSLNRLVSQFTLDTDIRLQTAFAGSEQQLSPVKRMTLTKLAQEALRNVQQHARAQSASLKLTYEPGAVMLTVEDDGVGLLDGTHERPGVHALRAIHYRLAELDGRLEVFEGEQGGVTVRGILPLGHS